MDNNEILTRANLYRQVMDAYHSFMYAFPDTSFGKLLKDRYGVNQLLFMSVEQVDDLLKYMAKRIEEPRDE